MRKRPLGAGVFLEFAAQAWGCGSSPPSLSRGRPRPAAGTGEGRTGGGVSPVSRTGGLPLRRSRISSPVSVSYSSRPLARTSRSSRFSVRMRRASIAALDEAADLGVDLLRRRLGDVLLPSDRHAEEDLFLVLAVGDGAELFGQAPARHHHAGEARRLVDVGLGAGGDLLLAEDDLLGDAAAHHDGEARGHLLERSSTACRARATA